MSTISSYKKQLDEANKCLSDDELQLLQVEEEMAALNEKKKHLENKIEVDRQNKVVKGMLYFSENRRITLLDKADGLRYSKQAIDRLRSYDKAQWNADFVDCDTIADFEAVEKYVNENEPAWERWALTRIGKKFIRNG